MLICTGVCISLLDSAGRGLFWAMAVHSRDPDSVNGGWMNEEWDKASNSFVHLFIHHTFTLNLLCARLWDTETRRTESLSSKRHSKQIRTMIDVCGASGAQGGWGQFSWRVEKGNKLSDTQARSGWASLLGRQGKSRLSRQRDPHMKRPGSTMYFRKHQLYHFALVY